jgi:3-oxoacyl-[acyl-carrier protein] reductase
MALLLWQDACCVVVMNDLSNKVAVVTGASKGIGAAIAKKLGTLGASVVVNYSSSKDGADGVVAQIQQAGGKAISVGANVAKPEEIDGLFTQVKEAYGKVDILVNNAGVYYFTPLEKVTAELIKPMFDVNIAGLLLCSKAALPLFPEEGGNIINIGSVVGAMAPPMASVYVGTKAALNSITRVLAKELGPKRIRVNAVNPGGVATEGFKAAGFAESDFEKAIVQNTPLGRLGQPEDIASVVAFLATNEARWITGSLIDAAGGWE